MKYCIGMIVAIIALNIGTLTSAEIRITPTTVGDNSIVNAIKKYSNITPSYVNRWKPFGLWIVGPSFRSEVMNTINNYIRVCKNLELASVAFEDENSLLESFPINWTVNALCAALKNLKNQGMYALALIAQVDDNSDKYKEMNALVTSHINIIDHNKNVLKDACEQLIKKREIKHAELVKLALDKATINEKKAKSWSDKFGIVKGIDTLFKLESTMVTPLIWMALYVANKTNFFDPSNALEESE